MLRTTSRGGNSKAAQIAVALAEWEDAEQLIADIDRRLSHQRQLIAQLARQGEEIISQEIVLESLIASRILADDNRRRLHATLAMTSDN